MQGLGRPKSSSSLIFIVRHKIRVRVTGGRRSRLPTLRRHEIGVRVRVIVCLGLGNAYRSSNHCMVLVESTNTCVIPISNARRST